MDKKEALVAKRETIDLVLNKIKEFQNSGELKFPANYIPENALKSAWLLVQEVVDKNGKPALEVCTRNSVGNALFKMVIQSLNPDKDQCYFIVHGKKLMCRRSYFGAIHVAKTVDPNIMDVYGMAVYEDDEFEYEIKHGKYIVTKHKQNIKNVDKNKIVAAYGTILYKDGRELSTVMDFDQIKTSWEQSPMKIFDDKGKIRATSTHGKFPSDMSERTVINKACKYVINASDDSNIVAKYAKEMDTEFAEAETDEEIKEFANLEEIDIDDEIIEVEGTVHEEEAETEKEVETEKPEEEPKQRVAKNKTKEKKEPENLIDMAEGGPGY